MNKRKSNRDFGKNMNENLTLSVKDRECTYICFQLSHPGLTRPMLSSGIQMPDVTYNSNQPVENPQASQFLIDNQSSNRSYKFNHVFLHTHMTKQIDGILWGQEMLVCHVFVNLSFFHDLMLIHTLIILYQRKTQSLNIAKGSQIGEDTMGRWVRIGLKNGGGTSGFKCLASCQGLNVYEHWV